MTTLKRPIFFTENRLCSHFRPTRLWRNGNKMRDNNADESLTRHFASRPCIAISWDLPNQLPNKRSQNRIWSLHAERRPWEKRRGTADASLRDTTSLELETSLSLLLSKHQFPAVWVCKVRGCNRTPVLEDVAEMLLPSETCRSRFVWIVTGLFSGGGGEGAAS